MGGGGGGRGGEKEEKRDRTERRRREREWKERGGGYQSKAVPPVTSIYMMCRNETEHIWISASQQQCSPYTAF